MDALDAAGATVGELAGRVPEVDVAEGFRYVLHVLADQVAVPDARVVPIAELADAHPRPAERSR